MKDLIKKYSHHLCIFLSVFILLFSFVVVRADASSTDESKMIDILEFQDQSMFWYYPHSTTFTVSLNLPNDRYAYVEAVVWAPTSSLTATISSNPCSVYPLSNNYFKIVYPYRGTPSNLIISFNFSESVDYFELISCKYSVLPLASYPESLTFTGYNSVGAVSSVNGTLSPGNSVIIPKYPETLVQADNHELHHYSLTLSPQNWQKYDIINVYLQLNVTSIDSIFAMCNDQNILSDITYLDNSANVMDDYADVHYNNTSHYVLLTLDLSDIPKNTSQIPTISISGKYWITQNSSFLCKLFECNGFIYENDINPVIYWFRQIFQRIGSNFTQTFSRLGDILQELKILNGRDSEAITAQQTQEEINVSVNNQLVGAVEDWNTNIEVVQTNYDMAFEKTTPALVWLASLADGIFNGMGWFGNVYFLVGLISVIMLVLSKSGLAHKIGSINRRKGD